MRVFRIVFVATLAFTAAAQAQWQPIGDLKPISNHWRSIPLGLTEATAYQAIPTTKLGRSSDKLQTKRVHLLLAAATADKGIGEGVGIDMTNMEAVFKELISNSQQLSVTRVLGEDLTRENVFRRIGELHPAPCDVIVFVFSGHGSYNDEGHFLSMAEGDPVYREDIIKALRQTGVRLAVLLSNGCNVHRDQPLSHFAPNAEGSSALPEEPFRGIGVVAPLLEALLLEPYGVVDINGASEGQITCASAPRGSTSLRPMIDIFRENREKRLSWQAVVADMNLRIQEEFKHSYSNTEYKPHTAKAWSLPRQDNGPRFGAATTENGGKGVRVLGVWPDYPATRLRSTVTGQTLRLEPGDVILVANGVKIRCMEHFYNVTVGAAEELDLSVRDVRTGQVNHVTARLGDGLAVARWEMSPAKGEVRYVFDLASIRALRAQAEQARALPGQVPDGWSESPIDPENVLRVFKSLRLRNGFILQGQVFNGTSIGVGRVSAVPGGVATATADRASSSSPQVGALNDVREAITGDGSPQSYLCASILSRELAEFGARWHGCNWTTHTLIGANPLGTNLPSAIALANDTPQAYAKGELPAVGETGWKWLAQKPTQWRPSVTMTPLSVTVAFYTYSPLGQEGIYRHVDRFARGSYTATSQMVKIAEGRRFMVF